MLISIYKKFNILKIDHIAVAVNSIKESINVFDLLGMKSENIEYVKNEKVNVLKLHPESTDHTIELLESVDNSSTIQKFLNSKAVFVPPKPKELLNAKLILVSFGTFATRLILLDSIGSSKFSVAGAIELFIAKIENIDSTLPAAPNK